ncbi:MAG: ABC transporter ATP-binding protein [Gemmatimonadetes bacterium]|nr:ABC transporter ATP-binding protein [Gemmatimonadota bacterium]MYA65632.1 ABC transporter ATP-binding protein [Gemmatimonadota bacterium]MYB98530.1 ABC transporter ATP-binding protein [Gemmatimonadota bacterium]MYH52207.1 ABC transporter ATP-binding protein [Gemmatimonadota bacterium]MYI46084.1 ABC transporter ATP-binding protein [Gemmatimonadota bacterium]
MVIGRLVGLVPPASSKFLIDNVIGEGQADLLVPLALVVAVATLIQGASSFSLSRMLGVTAQRAITEMRKTVQAHVARLPVGYFDSTRSGVLISRVMTDAEGIRNLVGTGLVQLTGGVVTSMACFAILLYLNWQLTVFTMSVLLVFGGAMAFAFRRLRPLFRERGRINAEVTGRLGESFAGVRIVKAFTSERKEDLVFARGAHRLFRNVARSVLGVSAVTSFSSVIVGSISVVMILIGGRAILGGEMTLGDFVMYVFLTGMMAGPLVQMASIGTQIAEAFAGLDRIRELRSMSTEIDGDEGKGRMRDTDGEIAFENVSFSYDEEVPVLRDVSLVAPPGSTTALVGSSGSGKSTLASLVLSFNAPDSGRVLVDGRDLARLRLADYRRHVGVVLQDNFLFDDTIEYNIRYGRTRATRDDVVRAARLAHCHEFITAFPDGYETVIGERGIKVSGGQRQRLAIARAILADPRILVLDEATSSLDSESEAQIQEGLRALRRGRTTFVIAHRLSTIRSADQILVIEEGRVVERGTHEELMAAEGRYRELHDRQYRIEMNRFVNPGEELLAGSDGDGSPS